MRNRLKAQARFWIKLKPKTIDDSYSCSNCEASNQEFQLVFGLDLFQ